MKYYLLITFFLFLSSCTTIEINEKDAFDNHKTISPDSFDISSFTFSERTVETEDGEQLNSWFLMHNDAEATVLYLGGNGYLMVKARPLIEAYSAIPVNLVLFDYRGYGLSTGEPSVNGIQADAHKMFKEAQILAEDSSHPIFIHGHSMGSFLSSYIAVREDIAGYILESPITEVDKWTKKLVPWILRPFIRFDIDEQIAAQSNIERVQNISHPLLILGGSDDDITPFDMAEELLKVSDSENKSIVEIKGGTHNDLPTFQAYQSTLRKFYESVYDQ